jgi:hypothetical protein
MGNLILKDEEKNWQTVHKSDTSSRFTSITKVAYNKFIIVGDNGTITW